MAQGFRPAFAGHALAIHQDHEEIYDAIARCDPAAAHDRMQRHISHVAKLVTESRT
jgi:DNA-binding FadR family transcriptional regulator